jgi:hypothetical protein
MMRGVLFQVYALGQGFPQVHLPAAEAGLVGDHHAGAAQVGIAVDARTIGAGEGDAAELVQGAAGGGHRARGDAADAASHFHFRVMAAVGDDEFHLPAPDRIREFLEGQGDDRGNAGGPVWR